VILPPVGSARSAILLLECIEKYFGHPIFHNPRYQIQVCSPCRLDGPRSAILAIAFYLGSDVLRRYSLADLTTTFSEDTLPDGHKHRGRRIVLYDGEGDLDRDFEWWNLEKNRLSILPQLPFLKERTDVLTCQSKTDIENINLMAIAGTAPAKRPRQVRRRSASAAARDEEVDGARSPALLR
jgi:hypothetical protein